MFRPREPHQGPTSAGPTALGASGFSKFVSPWAGNVKQRALPKRKRQRVDYSVYGAEEENEAPNSDVYENDQGQEAMYIRPERKPLLQVRTINQILKPRFNSPFHGAEGESYSPGPRMPLGMRRRPKAVSRPLHDPTSDHAIVLFDPTVEPVDPYEAEMKKQQENEALQQSQRENGLEPVKEPSQASAASSQPKTKLKSLAGLLGVSEEKDEPLKPVPVVLDPRLAKILRPHQVEGVKFLWKCTTGRLDYRAYGGIMADEMGLGKTLQCITLMWTLLRQSPIPGKPTIEKCIIACPSTLVRNWANELKKWLGERAINSFAVDGKGGKEELKRQIREWVDVHGKQVTRPVMIVSYETLRNYVSELRGAEIGLLLCDEGHRLKNSESQTFTALDTMNCKRRVILSGTPIQNDLSEYFSLLNFANPSLLGTRQEFRRNYENAILLGRDADATEEERMNGDQKLQELATLVNKFIIRRTNDILSKYLPVKYEHVVFCNLSEFQEKLYTHYQKSSEVSKLLKEDGGNKSLQAITMLKKLCNHPDLLNLPDAIKGSEKLFGDVYVPKHNRSSRDRTIDVTLSGKLLVLDRMLTRIRNETNDKIVLISNYTQTLDMFERLCHSKRFGCLRLDGTMGINKRQKLVDRFNNPDEPEFVFLLSSKAGGCGINLVGANRLILFDPDWNPAADQQALARVWRDGQKKDCFVYRFIATGTIEEKIFQRQSHKQSLSSCVVDEAQDVERHFSLGNLRELFKYNGSTVCDTHDTFKCKRCQNNRQTSKASAMLYGDTSSWNHLRNADLAHIEDGLLRQEAGLDQVSYCFQFISH